MLGTSIDALSLDEVLARLADRIERRHPTVLAVVNAAKLVRMREDPALRAAVESADLCLADGMSVVWASRILGPRLPERVTGIDLMEALLEEGSRRGWRVYFLGATPEVLGRALEVIASRYPGVVVAGSHHGYFEAADEPALARAIGESSPDVLFVAMSSPRKEIFLQRWPRELGIPVSHGVGGAFDVLAGKVQRAPRPLQRAGLEWAWRLAQEPRRLWKRYLVTNTAFSAQVLREMVSRRRRR